MLTLTKAFFPVSIGCLNIIFMVAATRVNAVFFLVFTSAGLGFFLLASALWSIADGHAVAGKLLVVCLPLLVMR